jgi:hypothetical protein
MTVGQSSACTGIGAGFGAGFGARCLISLIAVIALQGASYAAAPEDAAYVPLKLYDGTWEVAASADEGAQRFTNHCARTGLFFACEQIVAGKSAALVVFLPTNRTGTVQNYRIQALLPDASQPGEWSTLTIDGPRWVYAWTSGEGEARTLWRNTNLFSGTDRIHFQIENSTDGQSWKTVKSGDETRVSG